jgi:hypothetical protein
MARFSSVSLLLMAGNRGYIERAEMHRCVHGRLTKKWLRNYAMFADMRPRVLSIAALLVAVLTATADEKPPVSIVELPRPNSGTFSFAKAEARKSEIFSNAPSPKLENWKNPYMGFCVHIAKDDSLAVYNHWLKALPEYSRPRANQTVAEIEMLIDELPLEGNPAGVLITSDAPLKDSKTIHKLLGVLFVPSVQLFYARSSEQDGAANGSQSFSSETNRTASAAGSRS